MAFLRTSLKNILIIAALCAVAAGALLGWKSLMVTEVVPECEKDIMQIGDAKAAVDIGDAYFGGGSGYDLACARLAYERSIDIDPRGDFRAWHQLGRIDFLEGRFGAAIDAFANQYAYFGDTHPNVHYMLGLTYGYRARKEGSVSDWQQAEDEFRKYIHLNPASPWARTDLSWILFSQGKYEAMKPVLEEGLLQDPRHPWLLNMYGLALLNTNDGEGALRFFKSALGESELLTPEMWGAAYPGNDPNLWETGLKEMRAHIQKNIDITSLHTHDLLGESL